MTYTHSNNLKSGSTFNYAGQSQTVTKVTKEEIVFVNAAGRKQRLSFPHFETSVSYYNFITDIKY